MKTATNLPTSFCGINYNDVWYMPGGNSWMARFLTDAQSDYIWNNDTESGSLELSFEAVYDRAFSADIWINAHSFLTRDELAQSDPRYRNFQAFRRGTIYNSNARLTASGGNDYYESGFSRPDIVLKDLAKIFHPKLMEDHELYYFQQLK